MPLPCLILVKSNDWQGKEIKRGYRRYYPQSCSLFAAVGGAGALLSKCIRKSEIVCYEDLGAEAIRKLYVENFPAIVVIDQDGNNLYETSIKKFASEI